MVQMLEEALEMNRVAQPMSPDGTMPYPELLDLDTGVQC